MTPTALPASTLLYPIGDTDELYPIDDTGTLYPNDNSEPLFSYGGVVVPDMSQEVIMRPIQTSRAFGAAVRSARKDHGLSQTDLATMAGVGRPWLSELERGKRTAEIGRALSVLNALDLAVVLVPVPGTGASGIDLGRILGQDT